ncbi:glycosyltransferase [Streptococcaceae bacterium ESL0729]|nr:glycosyltransferase [Streptococcaceae bacterium ESL0729]
MISFVTLNFNSEDEIDLAVASIREKVANDYKIVIIDNDSPDKSGQRLKDKYANDDKIEVILNQENAGFARGMNVGFRRALAENPDFIAIMNPDSHLESNNFDQAIEEIYARENFAAYGPDINVGGTNQHQNPKKGDWVSKEAVKKRIKTAQSKIDHPYYALVRNRLANLVRNNKSYNDGDFWKEAQEGIQLHGAFVVFSKQFFEWRDYAFDENTFFYMEMQILFYEMEKAGLKSYYSPELKVIHDKSSSTKKSHSDFFKRNKFQNENLVKSCTYYLSLLEKDEI